MYVTCFVPLLLSVPTLLPRRRLEYNLTKIFLLKTRKSEQMNGRCCPLYMTIIFYSCCSHLQHRVSVKRFVSLQFLNLRQSVGLLGQGSSPSQGRYLTRTQNKHKQTSMHWVGFEATSPVFERALWSDISEAKLSKTANPLRIADVPRLHVYSVTAIAICCVWALLNTVTNLWVL
jgi:hypothetical protein